MGDRRCCRTSPGELLHDGEVDGGDVLALLLREAHGDGIIPAIGVISRLHPTVPERDPRVGVFVRRELSPHAVALELVHHPLRLGHCFINQPLAVHASLGGFPRPTNANATCHCAVPGCADLSDDSAHLAVVFVQGRSPVFTNSPKRLDLQQWQ